MVLYSILNPMSIQSFIAEVFLVNLAFHSGVSLSNLFQCFTTKTSTWSCILKPPSFFFLYYLYIRLVGILYFASPIINYFSWTLSLVFFSNTLILVLIPLKLHSTPKVVTVQQTNSIAYKLKLRSFWKVCTTVYFV